MDCCGSGRPLSSSTSQACLPWSTLTLLCWTSACNQGSSASAHQQHNSCSLTIALLFAFATNLYRSEYDRGVNTFSPEGRLFQVEYAIEAIKLGSTAVGIQVKEGVILAVEKRLTSSLLVPNSVEKIMEIDKHIGAAMSGLIADARTLVDHARVEAQVRAQCALCQY